MLVIDGSETLSRLFAEIFMKLGWEVAICNDRDCGIERLAGQSSYDVILLSDRVAGTNGVHLVRFIRSLEHRRTTAVVMVTGSGEISEEALAGGADEVLLRPISPNALIYAVDKHLD
ncbi:MAG: response regulator [Blastocatellia bacterium]